MTGFDIALWLGVAVLALAAARLTLPRAPDMDWERLLKLAFVTGIRGEVEAEEGDADRWVALGRAAVWYHPAARNLSEKLRDPAGHELPVPALPGERALLAALAALPDPSARAAWMFGPQSGGDETLYDDPVLLGPSWDLSALLGPGASWDAVAAWSPSLCEVLNRRNAHSAWVLAAEEPTSEAALALARGLREALGEARVSLLGALGPEAMAAALEALVPALSDRLVLIGEGEGAAALVRCLAEEPGLRDRVRAVVGVGARLGGDHAAWLAERFTHEGMDTEISRATPWFHLAFLSPEASPPGVEGLALSETVWPTPAEPETGRRSIETIDLGVLPGGLEAGRPELLGRALALLITTRLAIE